MVGLSALTLCLGCGAARLMRQEPSALRAAAIAKAGAIAKTDCSALAQRFGDPRESLRQGRRLAALRSLEQWQSHCSAMRSQQAELAFEILLILEAKERGIALARSYLTETPAGQPLHEYAKSALGKFQALPQRNGEAMLDAALEARNASDFARAELLEDRSLFAYEELSRRGVSVTLPSDVPWSAENSYADTARIWTPDSKALLFVGATRLALRRVGENFGRRNWVLSDDGLNIAELYQLGNPNYFLVRSEPANSESRTTSATSPLDLIDVRKVGIQRRFWPHGWSLTEDRSMLWMALPNEHAARLELAAFDTVEMRFRSRTAAPEPRDLANEEEAPQGAARLARIVRDTAWSFSPKGDFAIQNAPGESVFLELPTNSSSRLELEGDVASWSFSPNGRFAFTTDRSLKDSLGSHALFDRQSGRAVALTGGKCNNSEQALFSPSSQLIAIGPSDGYICVHNTWDGSHVASLQLSAPEQAPAKAADPGRSYEDITALDPLSRVPVAFSADEQVLIAVSKYTANPNPNVNAVAYDVVKRRALRLSGHPQFMGEYAGKLVLASVDGTVTFLSGRMRRDFKVPGKARVNYGISRCQDDVFFGAEADSQVFRFDLNTQAFSRETHAENTGPCQFHSSPDQKLAATKHGALSFSALDGTRTPEPDSSLAVSYEVRREAQGISVKTDRALVHVSFGEGRLSSTRAKLPFELRTACGSELDLWHNEFGADFVAIESGHGSGNYDICDRRTDKRLTRVTSVDWPVISPDGEHVAYLEIKGDVIRNTVCDTHRGQCSPLDTTARLVAFTRNDQLLLLSEEPDNLHHVWLWNIHRNAGSELSGVALELGSKKTVRRVVQSDRNDWLLIDDKVFDLLRGKQVATLPSVPSSAVFVEGGRLIATGYHELQVFDPPTFAQVGSLFLSEEKPSVLFAKLNSQSIELQVEANSDAFDSQFGCQVGDYGVPFRLCRELLRYGTQ